jgi:DNA helicase-2/ATP-dependent DNA helicase PcrA
MSSALHAMPLPSEREVPAHLHGLNENQREAVLSADGPLLVLAGAGSGKTRVLVSRIAHLVLEHGVLPSSILGITFTRKAAAEMRERLAQMLSADEAAEVTLSTFHALGVSILREAGGVIGVPQKAGIADETDVAARVRKVLKTLQVRRDAEGETPREVVERIAKAKAAFANRIARLCLEDAAAAADAVARYRAGDVRVWAEVQGELGAPDLERFARMYALYQVSLVEDKVIDYEDLICLPLLLFLQRPEVLLGYQQRWSHVTVDEYQDTDYAQDHLLRLLAGERQNLCVVGDDDQAIYSWRGAKVENIRSFPARYPGCAMVTLDENYRSQPYVLQAANAVLAARPERGRLPKVLWTRRSAGERLRLWSAYTEQAEAEGVANDIRIAYESGAVESLDEVMVLYRLNALSRPLEDAFRAARIPYRIVNGLALHERREVRDLLAYLRLAHNWYDLVSFERAVSSPARGVGPSTVEALAGYARAVGISPVAAALEANQIPGVRKKAAAALQEFAGLIGDVYQVSEEAGVARALHRVLEATGYRQELIVALAEAEKDDDEEEVRRLTLKLADLDDFVLYVEEFCRTCLRAQGIEGPVGRLESGQVREISIAALLDDLAAFSPRQEQPEVIHAEGGDHALRGAVTLMSVHSSKGLEAERVYVVGVEEKVFPAHARDNSDQGEHIAEESRLFYVAITRARKHLVLSCAMTRELQRDEPSPMSRSRFLAALPETIYLNQRLR